MALGRLKQEEFKFMAKYTDPICRKCRRANQKLYLKGEKCLGQKCILLKRSYAPGRAGARGGSYRKSDYSIQLTEKQKLKAIYGLLEKQFRRYFENAARSDNKGLALMTLLEMRLDNILRIAGFTTSVKAARQLINHEQISVNANKVKSANYINKIGDIISITKKDIIKKINNTKISWLEINEKDLSIKVIAKPKREEMTQDINEDLVVELYSK